MESHRHIALNLQLRLPLHLAYLRYPLLQHLLVARRQRRLPLQLQVDRLALMLALPCASLQLPARSFELVCLVLFLLYHPHARVAGRLLALQLRLEAENVNFGLVQLLAQHVQLPFGLAEPGGVSVLKLRL